MFWSPLVVLGRVRHPAAAYRLVPFLLCRRRLLHGWVLARGPGGASPAGPSGCSIGTAGVRSDVLVVVGVLVVIVAHGLNLQSVEFFQYGLGVPSRQPTRKAPRGDQPASSPLVAVSETLPCPV